MQVVGPSRDVRLAGPLATLSLTDFSREIPNQTCFTDFCTRRKEANIRARGVVAAAILAASRRQDLWTPRVGRSFSFKKKGAKHPRRLSSAASVTALFLRREHELMYFIGLFFYVSVGTLFWIEPLYF